MIGKYKVITLCGSTRFKKAFMETQKRLTLEGNIVISVGLFGHSGDYEVWESMDEGEMTATKEMLDDMHKRKIDMADEIYVINVGGYIGESTKSEIAYAKEHGKNVGYLEQMTLGDINDIAALINNEVDPKTGEVIDIDELIQKQAFIDAIDTIYHKIQNKLELEPKDEEIEKKPKAEDTEEPLKKVMASANLLKQDREWENAIIVFSKAAEMNPNMQQRREITANLMRCYIEIGFVDRANKCYIDARKQYGKDFLNAATLTYFASLLEYQKDYANAWKYAVEAYNRSYGKPTQSLIGIINRLRGNNTTQGNGYNDQIKEKPKKKVIISSKTKDLDHAEKKSDRSKLKSISTSTNSNKQLQQMSDEERRQLLKKHVDEEIERSCNNCKLYIKEDCSGLNGLCDDYEYAPVITEDEKRNWPTEMGPYVTGYGSRRKRRY